MKFGVTVSGTFHAAILGWSLLAFGNQAPKFNIDLVSPEIEVDFRDDSALSQGDPKAAKSDKPAPKPTKIPAVIKQAKNVGNSTIDEKSKVKPEEKPKPVKVKSPPPKPKKQIVKPVVKPVIKQVAPPVEAKKDSPVPTNKLASVNEPPAPVRQLPIKEPEIKPVKAEKAAKKAKPVKKVQPPVSKPKQEKLKTAKTQQRKKPDKIKQAIAQAAAKDKAKKKDKESDDELAALLNKIKPVATGAKRSTRQASLGSKKAGSAKRLSASQMNKLKETVSNCSTGFGGSEISENLAITVTMHLALDGTIKGTPEVEATGGTSQERRRYAREVLRYVKRCAPYDFLPRDQYDTWAILIPTFYPYEMFE